MNREDIIPMAREAGFHAWYTQPKEHPDHVAIIERFAALVAAAEREACEQVALDPDHLVPHWPQVTVQQSIAAAIRARGQA